MGESPWATDNAIEYFAAALLFAGGMMMILNISPGRRVLTGAWGFAAGVATVRFFTALGQLALIGPDGESLVPSDLVAAIGAMFCLAAIGFAFAVVPQPRPPRRIDPRQLDPVDRPGSLVPDARVHLPSAVHATPSVLVARDRDIPQTVNRDHRPDRVDRAARA
jgi:hypothetical protein